MHRLLLLFVLPLLTSNCTYSQKKVKAEFESAILSDATQYNLSRDFLRTLTADQTKIVAALTGSAKIATDRIIDTPYLASLYRKHAAPFDIKLYETKTTGSDHREFREAGFRAVGITEEYKNGDGNPYHHKRSDTFEKLDYQFLAFTTYLVFKVLEDIVSE